MSGNLRRRNDRSLDVYLGEIRAIPLLSPAQEAAYAEEYHAGNEQALWILIKANLRFVVNVAMPYRGRGLPLLDLINEGTLGLIKATKKFDYTRKVKLISYAVKFIKGAILAAIAVQSRVVRLPMSKIREITRIGHTSGSLEQEYGRQLRPEEIADELERTEQEVASDLEVKQNSASLDEPFAYSDDQSLLDVLPDEFQPAPDEAVMQRSLRMEIFKVLKTLTPREAEIVDLHFGLSNEKALNLEEIGAIFALTRERVRQIRDKAVRRLRGITRSGDLRSYLYDRVSA